MAGNEINRDDVASSAKFNNRKARLYTNSRLYRFKDVEDFSNCTTLT